MDAGRLLGRPRRRQDGRGHVPDAAASDAPDGVDVTVRGSLRLWVITYGPGEPRATVRSVPSTHAAWDVMTEEWIANMAYSWQHPRFVLEVYDWNRSGREMVWDEWLSAGGNTLNELVDASRGGEPTFHLPTPPVWPNDRGARLVPPMGIADILWHPKPRFKNWPFLVLGLAIGQLMTLAFLYL